MSATFVELVKENVYLTLSEDGSLKDDNGVAKLRFKKEMYEKLVPMIGGTTVLGGVTVAVDKGKGSRILLREDVGIEALLREHSNLEIDAKTGVIMTMAEVSIGTLPEKMLRDFEMNTGGKMQIGKDSMHITSEGGKLIIRRNATTLDTIEDLITFGLESGATLISVTEEGAKYKIDGEIRNFDKVFTDTECKNMILKYDNGLKNLIENSLYSTVKVYGDTAVSINITRDTRHMLVLEFMKNTKRTVDEIYDANWLDHIAQKNSSETGGIVIIAEKQAVTESISLYLNEVLAENDTLITYGKPVSNVKGNIIPFTTGIGMSELTNLTSDIVLMDFSEGCKDWDTLFELVDNGVVVTLVVNESTIYSTLNMLIETIDKQYQFRKLVDSLIGISVFNLKYEDMKHDFEIVSDYVYNNKQFAILLGSKTFNKLELEDKKYKHMHFNLGTTLMSIEEEITNILKYANSIGAHDISLSAGSPPLFRVNKDLVSTYTEVKLMPYMLESMYLEIVTNEQKREMFNIDPGDGVSEAYSVPGIGRYRVSVYRQRGSVSLSLRKIPDKIQNMDWCGVPKDFQALIDTYTHGLILVTGPTGTGKSTTLAAIIDHYNATRQGKIIGIEDPIEYLHRSKKSLVEQIEIGEDTDSYIKSLKRNLRNDPDIMMIGEIRDAEVLNVALNASTSGHLVLATLHTKGAIETINRMIEMTPLEARENVKSLLSQNLVATYTQFLLPTIGGGMTAATEIMTMTPAVRSAIVDGTPKKLNTITGFLDTSRGSGMVSMDKSIAALVKNGKVSLDEAKIYGTDAGAIDRYVGVHRGGI